MLENLPKKVHICEVAPRDGLQNETAFVPTEQKKELIRRLAAAGVRNIEITSFVNPKWIPALADCAEIGAAFSHLPGVATSALVPNMKGLDNAEQAGMKEVSVFMSATESHNKSNINKSISETLHQFEALIPAAKARGMKVSASLSTVFGCPFEGETDVEQVVSILRAMLEMGADEVEVADTIGIADPLQVKRVLERVLTLCDPERVGLHVHDTEGTAVANIVAALEMGITHFDSSLGGLGGCPYAPGASGNVPTEHLVYLFDRLGIETGIDLEKLLQVGLFIQDVLEHPLASNGLRAYMGRRQRTQANAVATPPA